MYQIDFVMRPSDNGRYYAIRAAVYDMHPEAPRISYDFSITKASVNPDGTIKSRKKNEIVGQLAIGLCEAYGYAIARAGGRHPKFVNADWSWRTPKREFGSYLFNNEIAGTMIAMQNVAFEEAAMAERAANAHNVIIPPVEWQEAMNIVQEEDPDHDPPA